MVLANVIDTVLNVGVFGFVALLLYLWRKPMPDESLTRPRDA